MTGIPALRAPERARASAPGPVVRGALALLALSGAAVGFWALLAPASFYASFPGLGLTWVADAGPYDEHLVRDVGALYLALLSVTVVSLLRPASARPWVAGLAWLVFGIPHLAFHAAHSVRGEVPELSGLAPAPCLDRHMTAGACSRSCERRPGRHWPTPTGGPC